MKYNAKKGYTRGRVFLFLGRKLLAKPVFSKINFNYEKTPVSETPFLLFANHTSNLDSGYDFVTLDTYIRFVAGDHVVSHGIAGKMLQFFGAPLVKNRNESTDVLFEKIKANIKAGINVGVHVEGGKTHNGETRFISKRNAVLVKECNCALVTYRHIGGYFKSPRWAKEKRKGPSYGEIVNVYTKEQIQKMSVDQIYQAICTDLYVNEYEEQGKRMNEYICENPAENVEITLYACPKCQAVGTLYSEKDTVYCNCGFKANVDNYGFWHSDDMQFDNIVDWDKYQKNVLYDLIAKSGSKDLLFDDANQTVYKIEGGKSKLISENSTLSLYKDRLSINSQDKNIVIPIKHIANVVCVSKMSLLVVTNNNYYKIDCSAPRSATKYMVAIRHLQGKENQ